jgi:23S rRNA pseudouridine1911/1915/1917 synthase
VGEEFARPGIVHRLDRFTSGVMVAAKSDTAHWRLGHQFQARTVDKRYLAVVHGEVRLEEDLVDLPLGRHPRIFDRYAVRHDESGKQARTIYRVRERYDGYTLVELELLTGRTHQIRIHMGEIGHPIVGDDYYGGRRIARSAVVPKGAESPGRTRDEPLMARQALHAARLEFDHPISNQRVVFHAPAWPDIGEFIGVLRDHRSPTVVESPKTLVPLDPAER